MLVAQDDDDDTIIGFSYMSKDSTFNEDFFHSVFGLVCMTRWLLLWSLHDLYEVWTR